MDNVKDYSALGEIKDIRRGLLKEQRRVKIKKFFKNKFILIGLVITLTMSIVAIFAPKIAPFDPLEIDVVNKIQAPSSEHIMGTDGFGRDLFSRLVYGTRISMEVGAAVALFTFLFGIVLGMYAGFYKKADAVIMRICDGLKAIPSILLALALVAIMGTGINNIILSLTIVYIPDIARVARSVTMQVRQQTYVEALRASGATNTRIIWRNIFPNVISPVLVQVSFIFATSVITEASLSFLGVGVPVPEPSWGNIINEGKLLIYSAWWTVVYPGIFIALSVLGLNLLGDGLRDFFDPLSN